MSEQRLPINSLGSQFALTVDTAKTLTLPTSTPAHCLINVNTQAIRFTTDGTAPTATKGIHVAVGGQISFMDPNFDYIALIRALKIIGEAAGGSVDTLFFD